MIKMRKEQIFYGRSLLEFSNLTKIEKFRKIKIAKKKNFKISLYNSFLQSDILSGHFLIDYIRILRLISIWHPLLVDAILKNEIFSLMGVYKFLNLEKITDFYKISHFWPFFFIKIKKIVSIFTPSIFLISPSKKLRGSVSDGTTALGNFLEILLNENVEKKKEVRLTYFGPKILSLKNFSNISSKRFSFISNYFFFMKLYSYNHLNLYFEKNFYVNRFPKIGISSDLSKKYDLNYYCFYFFFNLIQAFDSQNILEKIVNIKYFLSKTGFVNFFSSKKIHPLLRKVEKKLKSICF